MNDTSGGQRAAGSLKHAEVSIPALRGCRCYFFPQLKAPRENFGAGSQSMNALGPGSSTKYKSCEPKLYRATYSYVVSGEL